MKLNLLSIIALFFLLDLQAQVTVNLNPSIDNAIFSESTNSSGGGYLFSGTTCGGDFRRALIQFNIAAAVPAGATITAVTLTLSVDITGGPSSDDYSLHALNSAWGEGTSIGPGAGGSGGTAVSPDATWNDRILGTPWTVPGGDFGAAVATTTLPGSNGDFDWSSATMVTNVQNWLDNPGTNFGWILIGNEAASCNARRFGSKDLGTLPVLSVTYSCATPPTASCQNLTAYLDANGDFTLNPNDLDAGSTSNCGGLLNFSASQLAFDCSDIVPNSSSLILTAVFDGNLTGGLPKGVEVYAVNDIADLSIYGLGSATNGGGTDGVEFTFPAVSVTAGTYIYVASETVGFSNFFGFAPDYVDADLGVNGDDAIELFESGNVIDVFGDITYSGAQPWFYTDGFVYRSDNTGPDGSTFQITNWIQSGINALDPALTNATAPIPIPIGTFSPSPYGPVTVTLTVTDEFSNIATCDANIMVIDTIGPNAICNTPLTLNLDGSGNLTIDELDIDGGSNDACGLLSMSVNPTSFDCSDLGLNTVVLTALDIYGNQRSCVSEVTIEIPGGLVLTENLVTPVSCNGDADGAIDVTISGGSPAYILDWDNDGSGDNDDTEDLSGLAAGTYILTVTDQIGCSATIEVEVTEPDVLLATLDTTNISCFNEEDAMIDLIVTGGTPTYLYDWDTDGTGDNDDSEDLSGLGDGTYTVVVTDQNNCEVTAGITFTNPAAIDVSVTQDGFTLTANATGATYQWITCPSNALVSGETNATFEPVQDGEYAVIVSSGGCQDTSACFTILGLSLEENQSSLFSVFPNPANEIVTINTAFDQTFELVILDIDGRVIKSYLLDHSNEQVDVSDLSTGIYILEARTDSNVELVRLVVSR
jgi:hypothetical protein